MSTVVVPYRRNLGAVCAETVVADHQGSLPDLGRAVILVPEALRRLKPQFVELRARLLECARAHGHDALIPPLIATPWQLFLQRSGRALRTPSEHERNLLLAEALENNPGLFPRGGLWQTTGELLRFFDEVNELSDAHDGDGAPFEQGLRRLSEHWSAETEMLLAMWRAWNETAAAAGEQHARYRRELMDGGLLAEHEHAYLCGLDQLTPCQSAWARKLEDEGRLTLLVHAHARTRPSRPLHVNADATAGDDDAYANVLDRIFPAGGAPAGETLCERARDTRVRFPASPVAPRVRVFTPQTLDEHAWGLCLAVREWLHEGKSVGIVSLDRRLTRRARAVFERHGLALYDYSGWELSTTSSVGALQNLLAIAGDEPATEEHVALMRSPWCEHSAREDLAQALHRAEQCDAQSDYPPRTAREWIAGLRKNSGCALAATIAERVIAATAALRDLAGSNRRGLFSDCFDHLLAAMETLGMKGRFETDPAGERLLAELRDMHEAAAAQQTRGTFRAWRGWLAHGLENANFYPPPARRGVLLMNLRQSTLASFDAVAIAGLDKRHLPAAAHTGLVNEKIRRELHLETREQRDAFQFDLFRRLLEGAGTLLLSRQRTDGGRALEPSPWLRAIREFHRLAYADDLEDVRLARLARQAPRAAPPRPKAGAAAQIQQRPQPAAPRGSWPEPLSAAAHQTLVDCPYRFFARYALGLRKPRAAAAHWGAVEYGSHLHRCLQALHEDLPGLPGPMSRPWCEANLAFALRLADEVVTAEFSRALADNRANRHWRDEAAAAVAWYVRWMIRHFGRGRPPAFKAEHTLGATLDDGATRVALGGRIDLLAEDEAGTHVFDYKSGRLPTGKAVERGEQVQLPSYALLAQDTCSVSYLGLRRGQRKSVSWDGDKLDAVSERLRERLLAMRAHYDRGGPLPAWGAEEVCRHCDYYGLCRRPAWLAYSR